MNWYNDIILNGHVTRKVKDFCREAKKQIVADCIKCYLHDETVSRCSFYQEDTVY